MEVLGLYHYWVFAALLMIGFYAVIAKPNLVKKLIGLSIFQSAVFLLYITMGKVDGGTAPILQAGIEDPIFSTQQHAGDANGTVEQGAAGHHSS